MKAICGYCASGEHGRCKGRALLYLMPPTWVRCSCPRHSDPPCNYNAFPGWTCSGEKDHDGPCSLYPTSRKARKAYGRRGF